MPHAPPQLCSKRRGYMKRRFASTNDLPINETDRKFRWERKDRDAGG